MDFLKVIQAVVGSMEEEGVRYALIGGFAMALRGVSRMTMDLDFILMLEDMDKAEGILRRFGYQRVFQSANVSHYVATDQTKGRIDILHAFRGPTLGMLERAELMEVVDGVWLKVVHVEDLIGLKVQASVNDPARAPGDWNDICMLLQAAREEKRPMDWALVEDYLHLFELDEKIAEMKKIYAGE